MGNLQYEPPNVLVFGEFAQWCSDLRIEIKAMAQAITYNILSASLSRLSQLGDTFLSSKHLNYLAAIAEFSSEVRA